MTTAALLAPHLVELIQKVRFNYTCEKQLQEGLADWLSSHGYTVAREFRLSSSDRVDLFVLAKGEPVNLLAPAPPGIGIELKVGGSSANVARQLARYAESHRICALILVTNRALHDVPGFINGKPCLVVRIGRVA